MSGKIHPIIQRIGITNKWESSYFEKKSTEFPVLTFKDLEIKTFIYRFFKFHGFFIKNIRLIFYTTAINIYISYFFSKKTYKFAKNLKRKLKHILDKKKTKQKIFLKWIYLSNKFNKQQKKRLITYYKTLFKKKKRIIIKTFKKNYQYEKFNFIQSLKHNKTYFTTVKKWHLNNKKKLYKKKKQWDTHFKSFKICLKTAHQKNASEITKNIFINQFFESLETFLSKNVRITLTLTKISTDLKNSKKINYEELNKNLGKFRRFQKNNFFFEGIHIVLLCIWYKNTSQLLANFIGTQMQKYKRPNYFLSFILYALWVLDTNHSHIKGIKIKISGRFNGAPWARTKVYNLKNGVSLLKLNSKISFSESTAFTPNGTFGIKVWISEKT